MSKREYMTPVMNEELFAADEYVAACWGVACAYGNTGKDMQDVVEKWNPGVTHGMTKENTGCGYENNQYIVVDGSGNVSMTEINTNKLGKLPCTITDEHWNATTLNQKDLTNTSVIYWTTSAGQGSDKRTWHHMGYVNMQDANRSNHS